MPVLDADADELLVAVLLLVLLPLDEELHAARPDPARRATKTTAACLRAVRILILLKPFILIPRCSKRIGLRLRRRG
jgi:hypothetical protein